MDPIESVLPTNPNSRGELMRNRHEPRAAVRRRSLREITNRVQELRARRRDDSDRRNRPRTARGPAPKEA